MNSVHISTPLGTFSISSDLYSCIPKMATANLACPDCDKTVLYEKKFFCKNCHPKLERVETKEEFVHTVLFMLRYMAEHVRGKWGKSRMAYIIFEYIHLNEKHALKLPRFIAAVIGKYREFSKHTFQVGTGFAMRYKFVESDEWKRIAALNVTEI